MKSRQYIRKFRCVECHGLMTYLYHVFKEPLFVCGNEDCFYFMLSYSSPGNRVDGLTTQKSLFEEELSDPGSTHKEPI